MDSVDFRLCRRAESTALANRGSVTFEGKVRHPILGTPYPVLVYIFPKMCKHALRLLEIVSMVTHGLAAYLPFLSQKEKLPESTGEFELRAL
jgi:hypothetical protein